LTHNVDATGLATLTWVPDATLAGTKAFLLAIDPRTCRTSHLLRFPNP